MFVHVLSQATWAHPRLQTGRSYFLFSLRGCLDRGLLSSWLTTRTFFTMARDDSDRGLFSLRLAATLDRSLFSPWLATTLVEAFFHPGSRRLALRPSLLGLGCLVRLCAPRPSVTMARDDNSEAFFHPGSRRLWIETFSHPGSRRLWSRPSFTLARDDSH